MATGMTAMYRQFFQFPALESRLHWGLYRRRHAGEHGLRGRWAACTAAARCCGCNPAEAMRPAPPRSGGGVLLERIGWFWRSLGSGWRMVLRNLLRARVRTVAAIFAAAMGASVMVNGFMMQEAMQVHDRLPVPQDHAQRHGPDVQGRARRGRRCARRPGCRASITSSRRSRVACKFTHGPYEKKGSVTGLCRMPG